MNIFKKTFKNSLFQRVETRIMKQLKENIPNEIKEHHQISIGGLAILGSFIVGSYYFMSLDKLNSLLGLFSSFIFIISAVLAVGLSFFYIHHFLNLYRLSKQNSIHDSAYQDLNRYMNYKEIQSLTSEELQELFSLGLNSEQITYLQKTILNQQAFTIDNLSHLNSLMTKEEKMITEQQKQQEQLNSFLSQHELLQHPYMMIQQEQHESEIEKQNPINLSSRL